MPGEETQKIKRFLYTNCLNDLKGVVVGKKFLIDTIANHICKKYKYKNIKPINGEYLFIFDKNGYFYRKLIQSFILINVDQLDVELIPYGIRATISHV